ncbi:MAG: glycosyhydrolase, partial [Chitinophagaceae bacterium]
TVLPDHGRTGSAITTMPVTAAEQTLSAATPHLEYDMYTFEADSVKVQAYFSPTLNFHNDDGLKYAVSIDNETPRVISINKDDNNTRTWGDWVANAIIIKTTSNAGFKQGKHVLKFWMISPAVVLQKLVVSSEPLPYTYFGPGETLKP